MDKYISKIFRGKIIFNEPMSKHTTFRIGGSVDLFVAPADLADLMEIVKFFNRRSIPYRVIGNGSNLLVSDEGLKGAVIKIGKGLSYFNVDGTGIRAGAGAKLVNLVDIAAENQLSGLEFGVGIPGTLGGALVSNAGSNDSAIGDLVEEIEVLTPAGEVKLLTHNELQFSYRESNLKGVELIVLEARLKLKKEADKSKIKARMIEMREHRKRTQPTSMPSAGSVFKNPVGYQAGKLIESIGAKGFRIGDAQVSRKHANFIVNRGAATARDVLELIKYLQARVEAEFGIQLSPEIEFIR